jgi:mono/diheme cytochrome c family protein
MQRTATNITWNATRVTWIGGLAFVLILLGALGGGCDARDASAGARADSSVDAKAQIERGAYLVTIGGCNDCHTPWKVGANGPEPDMSRMLSGHPETYAITAPAAAPEGEWQHAAVMGATNTAFSGPWGVSFTANLTPDRNTGLGIWTEDMFIRTIRTGRHWGVSRPILPPMPWFNYRHMTDQDLKAVFAYLRSIPPVVNHVPEPIPPAATTN